MLSAKSGWETTPKAKRNYTVRRAARQALARAKRVKFIAMMLALELRPAAALAHALDDAGQIVFARRRPLPDSLNAAARWLQLIELARDVCAGTSVASGALEPAQLSRIVLVFPGALDSNGRVAASVEGFGGYDLKRGLREHLQSGAAEIVVASVAVADAWAQVNAGALRGVGNWLYLSLDEQIESVACARNVWLAPDLGGLVLERDGAMDSAARQGTLSAYCAGQSFAERARSYSLNVPAAQIWALSESNFAARSLARDYVSRLAQGLANAVAAFSPRRICIGGELGRAIFSQIHADLACELRDYLQNGAWNGDIVLSAAGSSHVESIAPGALALATLGAPPLVFYFSQRTP